MADHLEVKKDDSGSGRRGPIIVPFVPSSHALPSRASSVVGGPFASTAAVVSTAEPEFTEEPDSSAEPDPTSKRALTPERAPEDGEPLRSSSNVISDTIRRWARPTTLDELRSRGIQKVRSVSMSRVGALLEKAVNRALIERTLESGRGEALSLSSTAREQFLRLSKLEIDGQSAPTEVEVPEEVPLRERATSTLDRLKRELEDRRKVVADREKQLSDGDLDKVEEDRFGNQMRELFAMHAGVDDRLLEREVLGLVFSELRESRHRARVARLEEHQREIGVLERRVSKLSVLLGETENALRKVRASKDTDVGVSSIYGEVQGLTGGDDQFEQKTDLMRSLFEANLALRR